MQSGGHPQKNDNLVGPRSLDFDQKAAHWENLGGAGGEGGGRGDRDGEHM